MQTSSYTYQVSTKENGLLKIETTKSQALIAELKNILESLYNDSSKVKVCVETIKKYNY